MEEFDIKEDHPENIYAKNNKGVEVFINDAESGRKGYFCLGCDREMQAVKFKIERYKSYFRHDYESTKHEQKCTYSSETYRHKLAKEELYITKQIKVPKVLKYHPTDQNAPAIILKQEEFIKAHRVENEMPFFENEFGDVVFGRNLGFEEKHKLIQPDVAFFDENDVPILLIEIVATHKVTDDKKAKIRRLGINTVQITLPKDSPAAIVESLKNISRTKWIFNDEEAKSDYLQLSQSNPETVSHPDAEQRKLLGETFACRQAEIRQLISGIGKCLQSEQYLGTRALLNTEIARVEGFAKEQREHLTDYEERCREEFTAAIELEEKRIINETKEDSELFEGNRLRRKNLVGRYNSRRDSLEAENREIDKQTRDFDNGRKAAGIDLQYRIERSVEDIRSEECFIRDIESEIGSVSDECDNLESVYREKLRTSTFEIKQRNSEETTAIENAKIRRGQLPKEFERSKNRAIEEQEVEETKLESEFRAAEDKLREEFEGRNQAVRTAIKNRDAEGNSDGAKVVRDIISGRGHLCTIIDNQEPLKRVKTACESIRNGSYKYILERYSR